jgi:hypothetical protein
MRGDFQASVTLPLQKRRFCYLYRLNQLCSVIFDIADCFADPPDSQNILRSGMEQGCRVALDLAEPKRPVLRLYDDRHSPLDPGELLVRIRGDGRECLDLLTLGRPPSLPNAAEGDRVAIDARIISLRAC